MSQAILPKPFGGSDHRSFFWQESDRAALLVHGFPGTPAEMRPLGTILREAGWTVRGLMLPGLGADIEKLDQCTSQVWLDAVQQAIEELKRQYRVILLVGYSLGGALVLNAALEQRPDGLVLLAPFWSFGDKWFSLLWPVMKICFPRLKPLKRADFAASEVRHGLQRMFKNIDLEDPQIDRLCDSSLYRQNRSSRSANSDSARLSSRKDRRANPGHSREPGQGLPPIRTQRLINGFINPVEYHEIEAGHDLVDPGSGAWDQVKERVLVFASSLRR